MAVDFKSALADWKKVKPLLLTKTGVSEALRLFNGYDFGKITTVEQCKHWYKVIETVKDKVSDALKKLDAEKYPKVKVWLESLKRELGPQGKESNTIVLAIAGKKVYDAEKKAWVAK